MSVTRRSFLSAALLLPAALRQPAGGARFISTVPLGDPGGGRTPPFGRLLGSGLDARLFTDLSVLSPDKADTLVTPAHRFFVRTAFPSTIQRTSPWIVRVAGLVKSEVEFTWQNLEALVGGCAGDSGAGCGGRWLMECSGNIDQSNYGLMSVGDWDGIPLRTILRTHATPAAERYRILISGADDAASPGRTSVPGASWIFAPGDLDRALLATRLNGAPLPRDHGFPVRLVVPGWYGCACIKWVNRIELVADDAPATAQMREFAARTHQMGVPPLARDFLPALIDTAAMPVRVEKWVRGGSPFYRVVGIVWGGSKPTSALSIRFKSGEAWVRVDECPMPASTLTWSMWSHTWHPTTPGRYQIVLRVEDPSIRTRRLDLFFYVREVVIDEV